MNRLQKNNLITDLLSEYSKATSNHSKDLYLLIDFLIDIFHWANSKNINFIDLEIVDHALEQFKIEKLKDKK